VRHAPTHAPPPPRRTSRPDTLAGTKFYEPNTGNATEAKIAERTVDYTTVASDHCPLWVSLAWKK